MNVYIQATKTLYFFITIHFFFLDYNSFFSIASICLSEALFLLSFKKDVDNTSLFIIINTNDLLNVYNHYIMLNNQYTYTVLHFNIYIYYY